MNFCRRCGEKINHQTDHVFRCVNGHVLFANSSPTVGLFLVTPNDKLLMTVRGIEPHKGTLDIIGGFVDGAETLEAAIYRELVEETGLTADDITEPEYLTSTTNTYMFKGEALPVLGTIFWARMRGDAHPIASDDVEELVECDLDDLAEQNLYPGDLLRASVKLRQILEK